MQRLSWIWLLQGGWGDLEAVLLKMEYDSRLASQNVTYVIAFHVLVNRDGGGLIMPRRGIRQRDPLSLTFWVCRMTFLGSFYKPYLMGKFKGLRWIKEHQVFLTFCFHMILSYFVGLGAGRPKMSCNEVIRHDMKFMGVTEDMAQDRNLWRSRIKIVEHRQRLQQWMLTWSVGLRQDGHQGSRVDWSMCGYFIFCVLFVSFVPTWRTRGRAVPILLLYFLLVCTILKARFVDHYWFLDLDLLHNSYVYLLYFW